MEALALITYIGVTGQIQKHATAPICRAYYKDKAKKLEKTGLLSQEELNTLRNVDIKKIKMAGEDFLNRLSQNRKKLPADVSQYIEKLDKIVEKAEGESKKPIRQSLEDFVLGLKNNKPNDNVPKIAKGLQKTDKKALEVLKPMKVFQNTRIALSQLSVWILAVAIIPPLCNAVTKPVMKKIGPKINNSVEKKSVDKQSLNSISKEDSRNTVFKKNQAHPCFQGSFANCSMRMRV